MARLLIPLILAFCVSLPAQAQNLNQGEGLRSFKRGTAIIMFSGLAGGVLGLSTLSFYGQPEEHTRNITTGALIGMVSGAGFLLWESQQGTSSRWGIGVREDGPTLSFQGRF